MSPPAARRVLVVDDDAPVRRVLAEALAGMGLLVDCAADGLEALARLRAGPLPCAVLLDMHMPGLDGEGFLRALRADAALGGLPVVSMTGLDEEPPTRVEASLRKPFDLDELARVLDGLCG